MKERVCPSCGKTTKKTPYCHRCAARYAKLRREGKHAEWRAHMAASPWRSRPLRNARWPGCDEHFRAYYDARREGRPPKQTLLELSVLYDCHRATIQKRFAQWVKAQGLPPLEGRRRKGLGRHRKRVRGRQQRTAWAERMQRIVAQQVYDLQRDGNAANSEIAELARELDVDVRTLYHWRDRYFPRPLLSPTEYDHDG